jgi:Glyoxalase-like domain
MNATIDHVFICCSVGAGREAEALLRLGLKEGSSNTHPGQGTACRRFFFANAYLELFWVSDPREAQAEEVLPTRLWERWSKRSRGACPFGIILRPTDHSAGAEAPFPTWAYRPSYMPAGVSIDIAKDTPLTGPEFFYLAFQRGPAQAPQPRDHSAPIGPLVGVTVWRPASGDSRAARELEDAGLVTFRDADEYRLELRFESASPGGADLGPRLPLTMVW